MNALLVICGLIIDVAVNIMAPMMQFMVLLDVRIEDRR